MWPLFYHLRTTIPHLLKRFDKLEYKSEKHEQFWKEDNTADDCSRDSTNQNGAGTNILHIANSIILFRLYDIG